MSDKHQSSIANRLVGMGAGIAAAWLARKAVNVLWRRTAGHPAPQADDKEASFAEIVLATGVTAAFVAVGRLIAARLTARHAALPTPDEAAETAASDAHS
ncbi:MAG: DUF4235 domain-containing protein [Micrococcales bacterium]|nr:DUF4235 domain-containing protein [Micrococcales bacterium]